MKKAANIDELYRLNEGQNNNLTGQAGMPRGLFWLSPSVIQKCPKKYARKNVFHDCPPAAVAPLIAQIEAVTQAAFSHQWRSLQTGAGESLRPAHVDHVLS